MRSVARRTVLIWCGAGTSLALPTIGHASTRYFAVCDQPHGVVLGWEGPERDTYAEAEEDGRRHTAATTHVTDVSTVG